MSANSSPTSRSGSSTPPETPRSIEAVLEEIRARLAVDVDCSPYVAVLKSNFIFSEDHLKRLPSDMLSRLSLPLLLEHELAQLAGPSNHKLEIEKLQLQVQVALQQHQTQAQMNNMAAQQHPRRHQLFQSTLSGSGGSLKESKSSGAIVERRSKRDSVSGSDSDEDSQINIHALFNGLSNDQRAEMVEQWKALVALGADDARSSGINKFYDVFHETLSSTDGTARALFENQTQLQRGASFFKMINMIIKLLEDPVSVVPLLPGIALKHLLWGLEGRHFQSFAFSFTTALALTLGSAKVTPTSKELWFAFITRVGSLLSRIYADIREEGKGWKRYFAVLTHDSVLLYRDAQRTKLKETIPITNYDELEVIEEGDERIHKPTQFGFMLLGADSDAKYFCVDSSSGLRFWVQELRVRFSALDRGRHVPARAVSPRGQRPDTPTLRLTDSTSKSGGAEHAPRQQRSMTLSVHSKENSVLGKIKAGTKLKSRKLVLDESQITSTTTYDELALDFVYTAFLTYCHKRLCAENVLFWKAVQQFKKEESGSASSSDGGATPHAPKREAAQRIFDQFLKPDAPDGLAVSNVHIRTIKTLLGDLTAEITSSIFDKAVHEVEHLILKPTFAEWTKTLPSPTSHS